MRLKGIKGIVLLVAAVLLLIIPLATMVVAAGGIDPEDFDWDARYWWEAPPLTAYEREQMREIMVLVLDRYFGIDVSTMSPEEFQELGRSIEPEGETEALQLFEHYARERGFQMPAGIFEMPVQRPVPPPAEVSYWWELVDPDLHEARITHFQEMFPEVNVRNMTPEEFERRLNPPPPPLRLLTIEEMKAIPGVVAVYGRARTYSAQAEIEKWLDELRGAYCGGALVDGVLLNSIGVSHRGYISVGLNMDELTIKEAQALAPQIYVAISERAERLGIQDVPVVFHLTKVRLTTATIQSPEAVATAALPPAQPGYDVRYRPIPGGVEIKGVHRNGNSAAVGTTGFAVRRPIAWWPDDIDYIVTGHLGERNAPTHVGMPIYQPRLPWRKHSAGIVEEVATVRSLPGGLGAMADVARVAIHNWHVRTCIHLGHGVMTPVVSYGHARVGDAIKMSGRASGNLKGTVLATDKTIGHPTFIRLFHQSIARFDNIVTDSGAPIFRDVASGVEVLGNVWGRIWYQGAWRTVFSPISGIKHELPGWEPNRA